MQKIGSQEIPGVTGKFGLGVQMNQGKLEVVKQEMARVNINILRISELRCTGMGPSGNLTQMTIISTTVGRNPLEEME